MRRPGRDRAAGTTGGPGGRDYWRAVRQGLLAGRAAGTTGGQGGRDYWRAGRQGLLAGRVAGTTGGQGGRDYWRGLQAPAAVDRGTRAGPGPRRRPAGERLRVIQGGSEMPSPDGPDSDDTPGGLIEAAHGPKSPPAARPGWSGGRAFGMPGPGRPAQSG